MYLGFRSAMNSEKYWDNPSTFDPSRFKKAL
jgi:cytochrome P450